MKNKSYKILETYQVNQNLIKNKFNYEKIGVNLFNLN